MLKTIICILTVLALQLSAQTEVVSNFDREVNTFLFNGDWQKSDSLINSKLNEQPNSLKYNFLKAYNYFYTRYVGNNNQFTRDQTIRQVKKYAWDAIVSGEQMEENLENNFYLGSAYAYLSRANIMEQDFWEGYWNASKSENYLEDVIDENPDFADAYLNLGVIEYFPALNVTGFQSFLAWIGGMSGDREKGIDLIEKVSEKGDLYKFEANYILGLMYNFAENDVSRAYDNWKLLNDRFPQNLNFQTQVSRSYLTKLVDEKGVEFLNEEFDNLDSLYSIHNPNVLNTLGYYLINNNRLDEALVVFKVNIKKYPEVANGYDSLAECYLNLGDNENAIKYYKIAFEKLKTDSTLTDQFREFLEENIKNQLDELNSSIDV
jgi:tetratricopeptide (TPR) repeat protein